jgi:hypothetical protein
VAYQDSASACKKIFSKHGSRGGEGALQGPRDYHSYLLSSQVHTQAETQHSVPSKYTRSKQGLTMQPRPASNP